MITIVATLKVKAGSEDKLINALNKAAEQVKNEPGNSRYELYRSAADPTTFIVYEDYADLAAIEAHANAPYIKELFAEMGPLFDGRPVIRRLQDLPA
jgi:quinol monooxygenase YgiN